ncbi:hypothetical protein AAFF_G00208820 [Aldrovandia affinis]|uniref:Uncharacterized protein n=1 Tax=Aldrovandia affinis TaxID=143900 RepID=A0AAD7RH00_9TELE|nr:hypothetical protein AAFF_G00208820 [Aldrovandia affinis]
MGQAGVRCEMPSDAPGARRGSALHLGVCGPRAVGTVTRSPGPERRSGSRAGGNIRRARGAKGTRAAPSRSLPSDPYRHGQTSPTPNLSLIDTSHRRAAGADECAQSEARLEHTERSPVTLSPHRGRFADRPVIHRLSAARGGSRVPARPGPLLNDHRVQSEAPSIDT